MGLRFRKSVKIAPGVKLNLNKNSSSVTVGGKGMHYTVNSKGKTTKTTSIPGTGLSYSTTSNNNNAKGGAGKSKTPITKKSEPKKKGGCLKSFLLIFIILILVGAFFPSDKKSENPKETPKQQIDEKPTVEKTETQPEEVNAADPQVENTVEEISNIPDPTSTIQPEDSTNNFDTYNNPEQQQTTSSYVLNTDTMKFHNPSCKDVKKIAPQNYSTYDGTRDDLIGQGYSPCGHCNS